MSDVLERMAARLDAAFRTGGERLARGPFRVYEAGIEEWRWGRDLTVEGGYLHYHDGTELGRGLKIRPGQVCLAREGRAIWIEAHEGGKRIMLRLAPMGLDDLRALPGHIGKRGTFDEAAELVRRSLARQRWKSFGSKVPYSLATRIGLVCFAEEPNFVIGLFRLGASGGLSRRNAGVWLECDQAVLASPAASPTIWVPMLEEAAYLFDALEGYGDIPYQESLLKRHAAHTSRIRLKHDAGASVAGLRRFMDAVVV